MSFGRADLPAARAYVDSVFAAGGARVGRGARHPATWSDAYTLRVANVWQRQTAAGRPLSLQEARRGPGLTARIRAEQLQAAGRGRLLRGGLEHPRQRYVGPRVRGRPDVEGSVGFHARQYRDHASAERWVERLTTDRVQVIGYGTMVAGYSGDLPPGWRVLFTGSRDVALEQWDYIAGGEHVSQDGDPDAIVFERVERLELRWGAGIGD